MLEKKITKIVSKIENKITNLKTILWRIEPSINWPGFSKIEQNKRFHTIHSMLMRRTYDLCVKFSKSVADKKIGFGIRWKDTTTIR